MPHARNIDLARNIAAEIRVATDVVSRVQCEDNHIKRWLFGLAIITCRDLPPSEQLEWLKEILERLDFDDPPPHIKSLLKLTPSGGNDEPA